MIAIVALAGAADAGRHVVRPGETLSSIAAAEGTTPAALAQANGITDPDLVVIGTRLIIPGQAAATYTVKPGDTLAKIAAKSGTSVSALAQANGLTNPNLVVIGTTLRLLNGIADAAAPIPTTTRYTVKLGENLSAIAAKVGASTQQLIQANGLRNPNLVVAGTVLKVPTSAAARSSAALPARLRARPERLALRPTFERWAAAYGVPADLFEALCWMESGWQNSVISSTGAIGIGQLMPETVAAIRNALGDQRLDPNDPATNIRMSAWWLGNLLRQTDGDAAVSLAAYYQGLRSVRTRPWYEDTKQYVAVILALRPHFA